MIKDIISILESVSLVSGAIIVAIASALLTLIVARGRLYKLRWLFIAGLPFIFSYSLYWSPVWLGADGSEYSAWAPICIVPWYLLGVVLSGIVMYVYAKVRHSDKKP